jgi:HTH-type transcriptional regulator/antitoxin HigA
MAAATTTRHPYEPDYAVAPGGTLLETIEALGMDQKDLATRLGLSEKHVSQLVNGHVALTYEVADRLELVTGVPARIWNSLESNYRERLAKAEAAGRLAEDQGWLKRVPTKELVERKKVKQQEDGGDLLRATLAFFGVSSVEAWRAVWLRPTVSFRRSRCFDLKPEVTAAWLRLGELEAIAIRCDPFDKARFRSALAEIRTLTVAPPREFQPKMTALCAAAGVALVFVPEIKGCPASGVARWLTPDKALIQLSLRHKTDDHLWFSFFHEAGHVLNDPKKEIFIDDGSGADDERERQADAFASNFLIPANRAAELAGLRTPGAITRFAESVGIAPGIVVGRLQHDKVFLFSQMNGLKQKLAWSVT